MIEAYLKELLPPLLGVDKEETLPLRLMSPLQLHLLRDDVITETDRQPRDQLQLDVQYADGNLALRP